MRFPTKWHLSQAKNIQAPIKGSDQTAHMRRLILDFVGHTYHIVRNLMSRLNYIFCCKHHRGFGNM